MTNATLAGTRLEFADLIAIQHFTRRLPNADHNDLDQVVIEEQVRTLVKAVTAAVTAATRSGALALVEYLNSLPAGVVEFEADT